MCGITVVCSFSFELLNLHNPTSFERKYDTIFLTWNIVERAAFGKHTSFSWTNFLLQATTRRQITTWNGKTADKGRQSVVYTSALRANATATHGRRIDSARPPNTMHPSGCIRARCERMWRFDLTHLYIGELLVHKEYSQKDSNARSIFEHLWLEKKDKQICDCKSNLLTFLLLSFVKVRFCLNCKMQHNQK